MANQNINIFIIAFASDTSRQYKTEKKTIKNFMNDVKYNPRGWHKIDLIKI